MGTTYISMSAANYVVHTVAAIIVGAAAGAMGAAAFMQYRGPKVNEVVNKMQFIKGAKQ